MTRIILVSGKGGVGKTTVAAATGLAAARRGYRTLVMSIDAAHSLSDSFDVESSLFDQNAGLPFNVANDLDLQEIDVQQEVERNWSEIYRYVAEVLTSIGLDGVIAEELAIVPGTEEVIALACLNAHLRDESYDAIILDAPPTADSLRFVGIFSTLDWYMRKRFPMDRRLIKLVGPLVERLTDAPLPNERFFQGIQRLFERLEHVDGLLMDSRIATVRLVTTAEKMVVRETQRAYSYFSLYGMTTDQVIVNRMMPLGNAFMSRWSATQHTYVDEMRGFFRPVPVTTLPLFDAEVVGIRRIEELADALYGESDPLASDIESPAYEFRKDVRGYTLVLPLPFVDKGDVDLTRVGEDLVVRVGAVKRYVPIPRSVQKMKTAGARVDGVKLFVRFTE